ncbi:lysine rich nucleolar protein 1 [Rhinolophus ferrumequinum]|nr:lysine-rich nucleolar protein 1 [Rhinolophus ferrumequinum]XP_032957210.1 lysine-rich nucleolar protein 1 [Rhinolophus ferrumequinum]KAF6272365.1 lysine rich nucleolar protein 1 [Rhinolophus ferrumequinum]
MITKTHEEDLGFGLPEKKKKKKKKKVVVKETETQYSVLNSDNYFSEVCPPRAISPSKSGVQGQVPKMPLVKQKKKKKGHSTVYGEHPDAETAACARQTELPGPRKQPRGPSESLCGEKKNKKSLRPLATSPGSRVKTSPDPRQDEEVTRVGKKLKKHKKEKKAQEAADSAPDPWFCEAGGALHTCSVGKGGQELAALGQKRKQGSPQEPNAKMKKKKKIHQEGDTPRGHPEPSRSVKSSPRKGSKKKPVKVEASEYIPIGDGPKAPAKKKTKSKKKAELPGTEEPALKKKKKRKESKVGEPWEEEPDTDLEVVLEKKGNMDETHIDQVRRKALQEEIDRESGKTEASETRKWTGTQFGQWDTAGFENEEQKLKFLKLMGGFKNLSPALRRPPHTTDRPNMALSKAAADGLQQSLQQDYERAASWKYRRGAGLGFPTAPNKVFYIDRNASRSIKFED